MNEMTIKNEPEKRLIGFLQADGSKVYIEPIAIKNIEEYGNTTIIRCGHNPKTGEAAREICVLSLIDEVIQSLRFCNVHVVDCGGEQEMPPNQPKAKV